ncbi:MAG TPA: hypothetical protein VJ750_04550 [Rhizomicrobium sp.]|nr:hypothetical protein [Rhizomicrobium sp.]
MTMGSPVPPAVVEPVPPPRDVSSPAPVAGPVAEPVKVDVQKKAVPERRAPERAVRSKKAVPVDPARLIGMPPSAVRRLLGPPARIENDDLSREWVYASNNCSFRLFFYPNLNAASFRVLKYGGSDGNGGLMDVSDICIRHILMTRANATH